MHAWDHVGYAEHVHRLAVSIESKEQVFEKAHLWFKLVGTDEGRVWGKRRLTRQVLGTVQ